MESKGNGTPNSPVLKKILAMLDDLKVSPSGAIIHGHIEQMLTELDLEHHKTEESYASFLDMLIEACIALIPVDSSVHTHLRLVQLRLTPPLSSSELNVLSRAVESVTDDLAHTNTFRGRDLVPALMPVIERFGTAAVTSDVAGDHSAPSVSRADAVPPSHDYEQPASHDRGAEFQVNTAYRAHLEEKREEMQKLQEDFIAQLGEAVVESETFGRLLDDSMATLQQAGTIEDLEVRRQELMRALETLIGEHRALGEKFSRAQEYLSIIEDDNQQLSDELDRVRLLSMTDELTRLPNRRAFLRRLEDEVSRVQRHSSPLGLVLIDMDHFKRINDERGHAAGDDVLRCYSTEILSIFRHHDLVARYGGEEFAVLLPNTTREGVLRALEKVRRRVAEVTAQRGGNEVPMPTFSAGVAEFQPGEAPSRLIERADSALYAAKRKGRNRTEVSGTEMDDEGRIPSGA